MTETEQFLATMGPRVTEAEPRPYVLRVTTIFRREDGEWKVVHRHANAAADPGEVVGRLAPRAVI